ncbi:MAG: hypothetical protein ABSE95_01720 [Thermodesulfobacteriota bacterium]|jgi:hypothetical protein
MKKNRIFIWAIPVLVILMGLVIYQYGFLRIKEELNLIREEQESKAKTLQKYLAIIAEKPDLEKRLITIKDQRRAETAKLMEGETFSLAAAALQDMVKGIITSRGGIISSERIGKEEEIVSGPSGPKKEESKGPKTEKGFKVKKEKYEDKRRFKVVSASFDFTAPDTGALRDIVFFVETRTPYLVIKELDCRVRNFREPRELMVKLDVSALYGGK